MPNPIKFDKGQGDAPFNMAQLYYYRLNELMACKSRAKLYGDLNDFYACLQEIHTQISFKLTQDDNKKILEDLAKIRKYLYSPMPRNKNAARQMSAIISGKCTGWLEELDRELMLQLERHKMIFPRIDVRSPMQTLREDMGLNQNNGVDE